MGEDDVWADFGKEEEKDRHKRAVKYNLGKEYPDNSVS
jgi:hypothetical protein